MILTAHDFFFNLGLYQKVNLEIEENLNVLKSIVKGWFRVDGYSPQLNQETTFSVKCDGAPGTILLPKYAAEFSGELSFHLQCLRGNFKMRVIAIVDGIEKDSKKTDFYIMKIGQYPSLADMQIGKLRDYKKVISSTDLRELSKAIGLHSHGVGIGSFVYLRRIFENLVEDAHNEAKKSAGWNEEVYSKSRMDEKIKILKDLLPAFLYENRSIYAILSKGIHELSESDCMEFFEPLKMSIVLILEERFYDLEKKKKLEEAVRAIELIKGKI